MSQRIYVGNLPLSATGDRVNEMFSEFGDVEWVRLVTETGTGRSRGFGYVKMSSGVKEAIQALDSRRLGHTRIDVRRALPLSRGEISCLRTPKRARNHRASEASAWSFSEPRKVDPARVFAI
jgi:RNA recognition motif-containing protein